MDEYLRGKSIEEILSFMRNKLFLGDQKINNIETYKILLNNVKENKFIDKIFLVMLDSKLIEEVKGKENNIFLY